LASAPPADLLVLPIITTNKAQLSHIAETQWNSRFHLSGETVQPLLSASLVASFWRADRC
jgi:hypothetical protein